MICEEMKKLREYLDTKNIEWKDDSEELSSYYMCRTKFFVDGNEFSVINGVGSYGGAVLGGKNQGLLELWINRKGEPQGYLTADNVIERIKEYE